MDITVALSGAKTAFELARALQNGLAHNQIKPEEIPSRLMELQQHILSMQAIVHDLAEENRTLREENRALVKSRQLDEQIIFHDRACWRRLDDGTEEGPFCPLCWGDAKKLVRPTVWDSREPNTIVLLCRNHDKAVTMRMAKELAKGY